ncbi:MAG: class I tRNA ligase family protein, partial [Pseudomonadota bacterium]
VSTKMKAEFEAYNFKAAWRALSEFAIQDLSAFYFDVRKDCLYCDAPTSTKRRATRTVMAILLDAITRLLAPICPFTAEEVYDHFPEGLGEKRESVHLLQFADVPEAYRNPELAERWDALRGVRRVITGAIEVQRNEKTIGASLEAETTIYLDDEDDDLDTDDIDWAELSITSQATVVKGKSSESVFTLPDQPGVGVMIRKAQGNKCGRCWKILSDVPYEGGLCARCQEVVGA